jgi:ABC-2 type transport system ATP-binding protein
MDDIIRLTDLEVRYGRVRALDGLSLAVPQGEVYGFLGRNGAGKTTTLRVLMGIVKPRSGKIELFGKRMRRVSVRMKRRIGYVSQEQHFYPWMTARRLGAFASSFYPTWDHQEFARLIAALDVPPDRRSVELSGGTRSKLALALALAPRPPLLLLDEPTTGLDPVARREFNELVAIMAAQHGTTVFFSSHLVDEVESVATRVAIVQAGRIRVEGRVSELRERVRAVEIGVPAHMAGVPHAAEPAVADALGPEAPPSAEGLAAEPPQGEPDAEPTAELPRIETAPPRDFALPAGFTHVRGNVWHAEPELWEATPWPPGTVVARQSLEDIFLAYARTDAPLTAAA